MGERLSIQIPSAKLENDLESDKIQDEHIRLTGFFRKTSPRLQKSISPKAFVDELIPSNGSD
jgi:hypothetical protein